MKRILLIDLSEREALERAKLCARRGRLIALQKTENHNGGLDPKQKQELARITDLLDSDIPIDPFYQAVASAIARRPWEELRDESDEQKSRFVLKHGLFGTQRMLNAEHDLSPKEQEISAVCGLLQLDNLVTPTQEKFVSRVVEAQGQYVQNKELYDRVFWKLSQRFPVRLRSQIEKKLIDLGIVGCIEPDESINTRIDPETGKLRGDMSFLPALDDDVWALSGKTVAAVVRRLVGNSIRADDAWIDNRIDTAFNTVAGVVEGAPPSAIEIMLPDLEESVDVEIQKDNLQAVQALYFACMLEEVRFFQVVERIVDLFRQGLLPLGKGWVGDFLFSYYRKAGERLTESDRRDLYLRAFGAPGGNPNGNEPNRDFNELWLRFVSAVSSFARQNTLDRMLRSSIPMAVSQEQVRKAGRDLGANLSRNGYGIAYFAATELQDTILKFRDLLQDNELRNAFGARDMWQVIEQVNANYLGGQRNTHRYRTQSRAGAIIIRWIANNISRLSNLGGNVISIELLSNPQLQAATTGHNPLSEPSDWDLVNACEQWLAVGGVQEQSIEQYSQSIESPVMTSKPMDMPQAARDVLDAVGISLPSM